MSDDLKKVKDSLAQMDYALDTIVYMMAAMRLSIRRLESEQAIEARAAEREPQAS